MSAMPLPDPRSRLLTKALFRPSFAIVNGDYTPHTVRAGRCEQDFIAPKHAREAP
jgi:hypothetical protein